MKTEFVRPPHKFKAGDLVTVEILGVIQTMKVISDNEHGDPPRWAWIHDQPEETGNWTYRLAFLTKYGFVNKRKNHRFFDEQRLTLVTRPADGN